MKTDKRLNKKTILFIALLSIIAIFIYGYVIFKFDMPSLEMMIFWSLTLIVVESLPIPVPRNNSSISVSLAISLATIIVGGPLLGSTASLIGILFRFPKMPGRSYVNVFTLPIAVTIFNVSQTIIKASLMGLIYIYTGGIIGSFSPIPTILSMFIGIFINFTLMFIFTSLKINKNITSIWLRNMKGMVGITILSGTTGIILALGFLSYGYWAVPLFFAPLLLTRYSFKLYLDAKNLYISTIEAFNSAMEAKDPYTFGHASRVQEYAVWLGTAEGLSYSKIEFIKNAAILHDIGKIGISDTILNKKERLTDEEFEEIKKHPSIGSGIIKKVNFLEEISIIIKYHHERYDGKGYPEGLEGDEIPVESSILAIADAYDAMTTDRPYRRSLSKETALEEIKANLGTQFHPDLGQKFIDIMNK